MTPLLVGIMDMPNIMEELNMDCMEALGDLKVVLDYGATLMINNTLTNPP